MRNPEIRTQTYGSSYGIDSQRPSSPVWRIATLFPNQGAWSEQEYLALDTNRRVEFDNGFVEVHDLPTDQHQAIISYFIVVRDLVAKRIDYAQAGIEEYWIVDPAEETVTVLSLTGDVYAEHGFFGRGDVVTSSLLPELALPVSEILDAD